MSATIRKDDFVQIIAGKDKDGTGKVLKVFPKDGSCIVEKMNVAKRHQKAKTQGAPSGIIEKNMRIPLCKVMLLDPKSKTPSRIRMKTVNGQKVRVYVKSNEPVDTMAQNK